MFVMYFMVQPTFRASTSLNPKQSHNRLRSHLPRLIARVNREEEQKDSQHTTVRRMTKRRTTDETFANDRNVKLFVSNYLKPNRLVDSESLST